MAKFGGSQQLHCLADRLSRPLALAFLSGLLMGFSPAPINAWWVAWFALCPLWVLLFQADLFQPGQLKSRKHFVINGGFWAGLAWGTGYYGMTLFWITGVHPMTWMGVPWLASLAIALFCWVFITGWGALLVGIWAGSLVWLSQHQLWGQRLWPRSVTAKKMFWPWLAQLLVGTSLWCGLEWLWSLGSLYWGALSFNQSPNNLVILHLGQLSGPNTVTAAIVLINGLLALGWISWQQRSRSAQTIAILSFTLLLLFGLHGIGFWLYSRPLNESSSMALRVGIVQGNIPNTIKLYSEGWRRAIAGYTAGYIQLAEQGVEAVLTPETALPFLWTDLQQTRSAVYQAILKQQVSLWLGGFGEQGEHLTNSLFSITGDGKVLSRYDKVKLVPLGEFIPLERWLGQVINRLSPLEAQLAQGSPDQWFKTPFGRAIVSICYESAFSDHLRRQAAAGGTFFLSAANNAHYSLRMPAQHHAQDVQRAIELDRWAVRATNTGYSGIVDPHGNTRWLSGINTYELHADTIYRRSTQTLYVRWGDWLTPVLLGIALVIILV